MPRIAYFGPQGTFTEQAARALAHPDRDELVAADTVSAAVAAVRTGEADAACVPVENSVEGAVPATMDALATGEPVVAVAETVLPVRFSVLVRPGTRPAEIRTVTSHPHALAQVHDWLATHLPHAATVAATSTAAAAVAVRRGEYDAAVTAPVAVEHYPLDVLATNIADVADAATRFLLVRRPGSLPEPTGSDRTSIVAVTPDRVGALAEMLAELALRGINLTRIESRPTKERLGEYRFFLDLIGHVAEERVGDALAALRRRCLHVRFLGSYPTAERISTAVPAYAVDTEFRQAAEWLTAVRHGETG
ncbi:prephenate dehydratase [Gandjariella thermophila]|uniref:Prephenate dehydratase n=1 Tax=Gandjariella thermophila TaxID=1931992 RepID=A0A4D4J848_9PSEU|nr:prephenate dehydratase [Gandjariella thermophila]GDY31200.1 prephenate dehydratase [Gandjariella thermophila]